MVLRQGKEVPLRHALCVHVLLGASLEIRKYDSFNIRIIQRSLTAYLRNKLVSQKIGYSPEYPSRLPMPVHEFHEVAPSIPSRESNLRG